MELLHLTPSVGDGGAEAVARMIRGLGESHGVPSTLHPRLREESWAPWRSWVRWARAAPSGGRVVHAHLPWPDRLGACLLAARRRPLVVTLHLLPDGEWPRDRVLKLGAKSALAMASRRPSTRWVTLSRRDQAALLSLGVRSTVIRNAPPAPVGAIDPVRFPHGSLRLGSVGRLHPQKGFDRMLDALAALRELPWHWCVAGDGESMQALVAQRDRLGLSERVTFLGRRPAADLLTRSELLLAPSRSEGMPLVPLEAVEAGVPVLASRIEAHEELFAEAPTTLLDADPARWPDDLAPMLRDAALRADLLLAQRRLLGDDPRERLWREYENLYRAVAEER